MGSNSQTNVNARGKVQVWDGNGIHRMNLSNNNGDIDIATPEMWRIKTGASTSPQVEMTITPTAACVVAVIEGGTVSAAGTSATFYDRDRQTPLTVGALSAYTGSSGTFATSGTTIHNTIVPLGGYSQKFRMKASEDYFIKVTAIADNTQVSLDADILQSV